MATCETCGNTYDKTFEVVMQHKTHVFDSFECAIFALAPACGHCGVRIVGHGLEKDGQLFLLRPLRSASGRKRTARPRLKRGPRDLPCNP